MMSGETESLVYFGPYLKPPIGLWPGYQFSNGLPAPVLGLIERYPGFRSLFIPAAELRATTKALKVSGSPQSQLYKHFKKLLVKN